jgi:RNA polymerase sigma-70 factor (ECF subfamily)
MARSTLLPDAIPELDILAPGLALQEPEQPDPRQGQVAERRFLGGMSIAETAEALQISPATVKRDRETARLFLRRSMAEPVRKYSQH